jgi:hypothetical protein
MKVVYYLPDLGNPFWRNVAAGIKNRADLERMIDDCRRLNTTNGETV